MPETTGLVYKPYVHTRYFYKGGDTVSENIVDYQWLLRQEDNNPKQSRVRPKPLYKFPTSLPRQTHNLAISGKKSRTVVLNADTGYCKYEERPQGAPTHILPFPAEDLNWPLELRLRIKDELVNLGETLAEYRETCGMFATLANKIWLGAGYLRKARLRRQSYTLHDISAAHLVNEFGLRPLMSDLSDSLDVLSGRILQPVYRRMAVTLKEEDIQRYNGMDYNWKRSQKAVAYVQLNTKSMYPIGFTAGNPLEIAWALVPSSWLVDYIIPVGDMLSSLDALTHFTLLSGTVTTKREYVCGKYTAPGYVVDEPGRREYRDHSRVTFSSVPLPQLPTWDPSKSYKRVANALAVLHQLRKPPTPRYVKRARWWRRKE